MPPDILLFILTLPLRIFWWAFKKDFGLLDEPPATNNKAPNTPPSSPPTLWDRELDGPDLR
jgi:hypothetical protein